MRYRTHQSLIGMFGLGTFLIAIFVIKFLSSQIGQFLIPVSAVLLVIYAIVKFFFLDTLYEKFGTKFAQKRFVINNTTLRNHNCTILLTPKQKIVVMENIYGIDNTKKMFTLTNADIKINQTWYRICTVFDDYTKIEALINFFNIQMINIDLVTYDTKPVKKEEKTVNPPKLQQQKPTTEPKPLPTPEQQPIHEPTHSTEPPEENDYRIVDF